MIIETVFIGTDNENELIVSNARTGDPLNFIEMGVTKMEGSVQGIPFSSENGQVEFFNGGRIVFKLGQVLAAAARQQSLSLTVFDPLHTNGQVIIHPTLAGAKVSINAVNANI
ncbi:hypothetical protein tloyanaT_12930 [Thalassotalea loyana]|uniref:Uncharacterized protein n=1 Tax=Thalassotalea loyana TaxID=280483 RepID=A0ABQ6HEX5_9GAMM|nr:hypothetical protein [Thalassotalea loyana]GLX85041.1 hypothetical protein tloyanaT_12930 [Thalassotalea loyana]